MPQRASVFCNFYIRVDQEALVSERALDVGSVAFKAMSTKNTLLLPYYPYPENQSLKFLANHKKQFPGRDHHPVIFRPYLNNFDHSQLVDLEEQSSPYTANISSRIIFGAFPCFVWNFITVRYSSLFILKRDNTN
jgi:hypothetical protein